MLVLSLVWSSLVVASTSAAATPNGFAEKIQPFIEAHCVGCHGPDSQKAGLRLDTLSPDLNDQGASTQWTHVYDKLLSGEMPPKNRPRPSQQDAQGVVEFLRGQLHTASLQQQQMNGRVVVRRLNGTEYQNTLQDLLGTRVPLKEMLPEDNSAFGFDNVSKVLDLSSTHLLRYQEAAGAAITSVVPIHPPIPFSDRRTGLEMSKKGPNFQQTLGRSCKLQGEALIVYSKLPRYGLCSTGFAPTAGRYRVKMSVCAVGGEGKPIPVGLMTVEQSGRESPVLKDVREIPHCKPQVIELEFDLQRRQAFVVNLLTTWDSREFKKPIDEYTGPGLLVEWMSMEGPIDAFPPPSYNTLFAGVPLKARSVVKAEAERARVPTIAPDRSAQSWHSDPLEPASSDPRKDADRLIRDFLPRAFRRPVNKEVADFYVGRVLRKLDEKYSFYDAMQYGYKLALCSPDSLFLIDSPANTPDASGRLTSTLLDDYSLAQRLSYFLCSTSPDSELLAAATRNELSRPAVLHAQVERLLNSPGAARFTKNFAGQWLDLRKIDATIPDPKLFPDFDALLLWSMPLETEKFFEEVLRKDLSLLEFVESDWSMINQRLAEVYGIPGVSGAAFQKVKLPPGSHRGGVMTQASVLKVTADGTRTSPVLRGRWVLERIVGKPPAPPPPDVPAIEPDIRGATTIRQQLDKHRNTPACASCHIHIDPPGFALETFDPIGNWRDFYRVTVKSNRGNVQLKNLNGRPVYRGLDVETGGVTPDGKVFGGIDDYKKILLNDKDQLARNLAQKLLVYSTGAEIQFADREVVEKIVASVRARNYGFRSLIHEVVQSRVFLNK